MSDVPSTSHFTQISQLAKGFGVGGVATVISKTSVAPVDRVKLILQVKSAGASRWATNGSRRRPFGPLHRDGGLL
ncbi:hypothetical protein L596_004233 [Steinernema carpocapsae]|uniref:ADP/ATP translocase n=1 Tax=Steinernema carpocapsae TaxID=34508 RepID=A0A4U8UVA1_STECR|nr:hypothetical protein L596_004233 [Steinernema carpocapsae]